MDTAAIKVRTKTLELKVYVWSCPGCGTELESRTPPDDWGEEAYCQNCQDKRYEERKAEHIRRFKENHAHLIGAVIVSVEPDMEYWYDSDPQYTEVEAITVEKDGKLWRIRTGGDIPYLVVSAT